ncbi:MAG: CaiB/BaiF CoA transferase family protein, partial [Burkholderiales bacterium]
LGAEVIKVESRTRPCLSRLDVQVAASRPGNFDDKPWFAHLNSSKRSLSLDMKNPLSRELLDPLIEWADVVVENFSPGTVDKLGVGWSAASARNARLVYCSLSGFGQTGPYRNRPALDPIIQAVSGVMSVTGFPDGEPTMIGAPLADVIAGILAAYCVVNALRLVTEDGGGQYIDLSMQDALLASVGTRMGETLQAGVVPPRLGNENPLRVPANTYRTAEGLYMAVMVHDQEQWKPFCEALEAEEWSDDPRFSTMALRVQNRPEMNRLVAARFAHHDSKYWMDRLEAFRIPYAPVNDYAQALADPQVEHRGLVQEIEHSTSGKIRVVGPPWRMSRTQCVLESPPLLGEHTAAVLSDWLGADASEIE